MNIATDKRPLKITYDKSKGGFKVMRGSSPIKTCKTIGEAEKYVRLLQAEGHLIAIRIFFHKLKPTVNPLPKERLVAK